VIDPGRAELAQAAADLDPGLTGHADRPLAGIDNGFVAGYRIRFDEAGPDARIRTSALLRYAQDVAWRHSEALGFDRPWYLQRGRWWVVRAVDLEVLAPSAMGRTLRVSTAVAGHRRIWARRLADARVADGRLANRRLANERLAEADLPGDPAMPLAARIVTDWVMLDDVGRLVRIPSDFGLSFTNPELRGEIVRVAPLDAAALGHGSEIRFSVRPHDLDPMGHVNNAAYLDWVEEGLLDSGADVTMLPRRSRLEYLASAAPGDEIVVTTWRSADRWASRIARASGGDLLRGLGRLGGEVSGLQQGGSAIPGLGPIEGVPPFE
jgi:acyl-ACP thioesterase